MARQSYSKDEKLKYVQLFAKSGLTKWEFVIQHPEIKRTTLYNWITKYFLRRNLSRLQEEHTLRTKTRLVLLELTVTCMYKMMTMFSYPLITFILKLSIPLYAIPTFKYSLIQFTKNIKLGDLFFVTSR